MEDNKRLRCVPCEGKETRQTPCNDGKEDNPKQGAAERNRSRRGIMGEFFFQRIFHSHLANGVPFLETARGSSPSFIP
jgi:hypothetical protein